ncbi:transposase [Polaribacter sp. R77954]|uniref:IS256 family transposase n=1 Tax=Polaribacter sp. R77954 TaxID=3093870 RepID=UPI0037C80FF7
MTQKEQELLEKKALEQLLSGKSLFGKEGAFAPMLKSFIEKALESEMEHHLSSVSSDEKNKRNGKGKKTIKSGLGTFEIQTPTDRNSSFEPELVKKRQTILAENLSEKIVGLYGLGMGLRDISSHIKEMYDTDISHTVLSQITDKIIPDIKAWQSRPLESMYCIVWLDAMHYKVRVDGKVQHKALYNILGINKEGHKEVLGMYVSQSEGANFWQ